ncbi:hypothetical protein Ancab_014294, partial [Ancistrocladus abbreviatus]
LMPGFPVPRQVEKDSRYCTPAVLHWNCNNDASHFRFWLGISAGSGLPILLLACCSSPYHWCISR